jgi:hypothetical protein
MAKTVKKAAKKAPKPRPANYDPPVAFAGTFEQMVAISTTGAGAKKRETKKK